VLGLEMPAAAGRRIHPRAVRPSRRGLLEGVEHVGTAFAVFVDAIGSANGPY
jgi:hypothetical protein